MLQKFSDAPLSTCPNCGGPVQKLFSPEVGLSFKGSGFYITDYGRNSNGKKENKSEKAGDSSKTASDEKKSKNAETKSASPKTDA
jgi:predicted nucleic acid-binding Zn ribbon protein